MPLPVLNFKFTGGFKQGESMSAESETKLNNLKNEKSPYLLQHADNPVNWYPWGEEAFKKARDEDKPVFLSIGYSTCHWCHVMEHESFEDPDVAQMMNDIFVNIKVDREERPDIDNIYMSICQMLTGSGGWPLSIIMTPDKKPFFAATYIPQNNSYGRVGMTELGMRVKDLWQNEREKIFQSADQITESLQKTSTQEPGDKLGLPELEKAYRNLSSSFDQSYGGFGNAPKFPSPHNLMFLLRYWKRSADSNALEMVEKTLQNMRRGGMYDHIGFGFHRYSTDARWFLPHFEKMLYDQAMLALAYIEAYQATGKKIYQDTANEIFEYVLRDMTDDNGGFYSAEDADSEGEEGKFYVFSKAELKDVLKEDELEFVTKVFNISSTGNYAEEATGQKTGKNILHLSKPFAYLAADMGMTDQEFEDKLDIIRMKIFDYRKKRVHPGKDDKILTDWNGLMIAALARGAKVFDNPILLEAAQKAAGFILDQMRKDDGGLYHRYREGEAALNGFIEDYAFMIWGLIELYEASFNIEYLKSALALNAYQIRFFWDDQGGGFFLTAEGAEELIHRPKEIYDGAIPSGNSVAAMNLIKLGRITADAKMEERATVLGRAFSNQVSQVPSGFCMLLNSVDFQIGPSFEIVLAGKEDAEDLKDLRKSLHGTYIPNKIVLFRPAEEKMPEISKIASYTEKQDSLNGSATAYVCMNFACRLPVTKPDEMLAQMQEIYSGGE